MIQETVELSITDSMDYKAMTCMDTRFCYRISKAMDENWALRAMDFIAYNGSLGREVTFTGDREDYIEAEKAYVGHSIDDPFLRPYEPTVLVHSTTPKGYTQILRDGVLLSWNRIQRKHGVSEPKPIGSLLGDPLDFSDYIMLSGFDSDAGFWNEIVVCSKEKGHICMDADCEYAPGARFYFDTLALIKDGLFVRDGAHYKVKDELPLSYALFCATPRNAAVAGKCTPRSFARVADEAFLCFVT